MAPAFRFLTPHKGVTVHRPYFLGSRHLSYNMFRGCAIYAPNQLRSIFLFPAVSEQYWFWLGLQVFPWQYNHLLPRCFGGFIVDAPISTVLSVTSNLYLSGGGCAIYSCIFGIGFGLQLFPQESTLYSFNVLVDLLYVLAFLQFQFWTCNPFWVAAFLGSWLGLH